MKYIIQNRIYITGALSYLSSPFGSLLAGMVVGKIGRKNSMLLVNIPNFIGWTVLSLASSRTAVFMGGILTGFGSGFLEVSVITYVSEIRYAIKANLLFLCFNLNHALLSQISLRGTLLAFTSISITCGMLSIYLMGSLSTWRFTAFCCSILPVVTALVIFLVLILIVKYSIFEIKNKKCT